MRRRYALLQKSLKMENITYTLPNVDHDNNDASATPSILRSVIPPNMGCPLVVGDFIVFDLDDVGQIVTIMDDMSLKVNCWLRYADQLLPEEQSRCGPIDQNTHARVLDVPEVLQTNGFVSILPNQVLADHAFVMHIDTIQDGTFPVNGMDHAFCTRKYLVKTASNIAGVVRDSSDAASHRPFSSTPFKGALEDCFDPFFGLTCYHSSGEHVFDGLMVVIKLMREMLFSRSKYQAFRNTRKFEMSLLQWKYIRSKVSPTANVSLTKKDRTDKMYLGDLSLLKNRTRHFHESITIDNPSSFEVLRKVFGRNFGIGVQKNFGDVVGLNVECPVESADILNVVGFSNFEGYVYSKTKGEPVCPTHITSRKNGNQVTLSYDYTKKTVFLSVAFTMVNATGNDDGKAILDHVYPTLYEETVSSDVICPVSIGHGFQIKRKLYKVVEKESDGRYLCRRKIRGVLSHELRHGKIFKSSEIQAFMNSDASGN
jgi:hypothetical protein